MSLLVIVPTRGRPQNVAALAEAWLETGATADLLLGVDNDDPARPDYFDEVAAAALPQLDFAVGPRLRMGGTLNALAVANAAKYEHIGFMGDDHRPRTVGWDKQIAGELDRLGTGIAYGNDLLQGAHLPTAVFMTANIVRTLGWMAPPGLVHLFLDNSWKTLGEALNALTYLPDVVIEHVHPVAAKANWDAGYVECNAPDVWAHDEAIYARWREMQLASDVAKIRAHCG